MNKKFLSLLIAGIIIFNGHLFVYGKVLSGIYGAGEKTYIVELSEKPVYCAEESDKISLANEETKEERMSKIKEEQANFEKSLKKIVTLADYSNSVEIIYRYSHIYNGMAIKADKAGIEMIKNLPGVKAVYESAVLEFSAAPISESLLELENSENNSVSDIGADMYADALKEKMAEGTRDGEGMLIAVIDTEFDVNHEAFALSDTSDVKIKESEVQNIIDSAGLSIEGLTAKDVYINKKIPFAYNYAEENNDMSYVGENIHGSHVAGIAAGNSEKLKGACPEAQLLCFKVMNDAGISYESAVVAAMDDAVKMNADVINLSMGTAYKDYTFSAPYAEALRNAAVSSTEFFCSAGNSGLGKDRSFAYSSEVSYFTGGVPAGNPYTPTVGNAIGLYNGKEYYEMTGANGKTYDFVNGDESNFSEYFSSGGAIDITFGGNGTKEELEQSDAEGKIVFILSGGELSGFDISENIQKIGGKGMVLCDDCDIFETGIYGMEGFPTALTYEHTYKEMQEEKCESITVSNERKMYYFPNEMSYDSSYTLNDDLNGGVSFSAKGSEVLSSIPGDKYAVQSGTSMASPAAAGAYVLVKNYVRQRFSKVCENLTGSQLTELCINMMENTADKIYNEKSGDKYLYSVNVQGAGFINLENLSKTKAVLYDKEIKNGFVYCGATSKNEFSFDITLENLSESALTYGLRGISIYHNADEFGIIGNKTVSGEAIFDMPENVTVPAGEGKTADIHVKVSLTPEKRAEIDKLYENGFHLGGFIDLKCSDENTADLSIPFTVFIGDFYKAASFSGSVYDGVFGGCFAGYHNYGTDKDIISGAFNDGVFDKNYISLSTKENNYYIKNYYYPVLNIFNLRSSILKKIEIYNEDGICEISKEFGLEDEDSKLLKYYCSEICILDYINELEDGKKYTIKLTSSLNADLYGKTENVIEFDFYIDNENPEIKSVERNGDIVTVVCTDNIGMRLARIIKPKDDSKDDSEYDYGNYDDYFYNENSDGAKFFDAAEDGKYTIDFDISEFSEYEKENFSIGVSDQAGNVVFKKIPKLLLNVTDSHTQGDYDIISAEVKNLTNSDVLAQPVIAFYNDNGKLIESDSIKCEIPAGGTENIEFKLKSDTAEKAVLRKFYIWDSLKGMKPISFNQVRKGV